MHLKVLWTALNVFLMHLGGNCHWLPPSFENNNNNNNNNNNDNNNNNNNNKKDIAHINFTLPAYLQLHLLFSCIAEARFRLFPGRKILVLPHQFGQHIVE